MGNFSSQYIAKKKISPGIIFRFPQAITLDGLTSWFGLVSCMLRGPYLGKVIIGLRNVRKMTYRDPPNLACVSCSFVYLVTPLFSLLKLYEFYHLLFDLGDAAGEGCYSSSCSLSSARVMLSSSCSLSSARVMSSSSSSSSSSHAWQGASNM